MRLNLEALLVGLFLLFPGFLATGIRDIIRGQKAQAGVGRFLSSILLSLFLAAVVIGEALLFGFLEVPLETKINALGELLSQRTVGDTGWFVAAIYVHAVLFGIAAGALDAVSPRSLLYRLSLSHVGAKGSVFEQALSERFRTAANRQALKVGTGDVPWISVYTGTVTVTGKLCHSSHEIEGDKAFEVFLEPCFCNRPGAKPAGLPKVGNPAGCYMRIEPAYVVEVFAAEQGAEGNRSPPARCAPN